MINTNQELIEALDNKVVDIIIGVNGLQLDRLEQDCGQCKITLTAPNQLNDNRGWLLCRANEGTQTLYLNGCKD